MIKNIPNKYSQQMLLEQIDKTMKDKYDFFYIPIDFKNKCGLGFAFINFTHQIYIPQFYNQFNNTRWPLFNSEKICEIKYGRL